ncbi:neutral ceramidase-like [Coregonus clupeaformis]|uniref:neutral ceramidase-like n=1 Tax=Coregonus clupeaformis TaxID=59861 RepID=UPI001BDF8F41|nr:neutral ceramidase-like [Coregonus clupeaformis]
MTWPLPCHPNIVDVQMITTGPVAIVTIPGEIITMPGRTREAIKHELEWEHSIMQRWSSLACVASTHYTTTYKEYQIHHLCIYPEV